MDCVILWYVVFAWISQNFIFYLLEMELLLTSNGEHINTHCSTLGRCSDRLSDKGIQDSLRLAKALEREKIDFIFCSDIGFRRTTADLIVEQLKSSRFQIIVDSRIREKGAEICSHLTKETFEKAGESDPEQAKILSRLFIKTDSVVHTPGTEESDDQLRSRSADFLNELSKTYPSDATLLVIGNPIFNSFFISLLKGESTREFQYLAPACALSRFRFRGGRREILSINQIDHLR